MRTLVIWLALASLVIGQEAVEYPLDLQKIGLRLPKTKDANLGYWFGDERTVFYKLPSVYQQYIPAATVTSVNEVTGQASYSQTQRKWGIFAASFQGEFNANPLFPWDTTAGLNESRKKNADLYKTVNFLNLPEDTSIVVLNEFPMKWIFPPGTTVGEIIYTNYQGKSYVLEVRTRTKSKDSRDWEPHMFRPIGSRAEFIKEAHEAGYEIGEYQEAERWMHLRNPQKDEVAKLEGFVKRLPALQPEAVKALLAKEFKDVTDNHWSPSADQDFHIMPRDYCFGLLQSIDTITCAECHRQTQTSVSNLIPAEPLIHDNPSKVGNIRGSDGVFTWYPFQQSAIRADDTTPQANVQLRKWDVDNRFVIMFDEKQYQYATGYKLTEYVQKALKPYELPPVQFLHKAEEVVVAE